MISAAEPLPFFRAVQLGCAIETSLRKSKPERQAPGNRDPRVFAGNCVQPPPYCAWESRELLPG